MKNDLEKDTVVTTVTVTHLGVGLDALNKTIDVNIDDQDILTIDTSLEQLNNGLVAGILLDALKTKQKISLSYNSDTKKITKILTYPA